MLQIKFRVIWSHELQDYNVLVLKKDVEIFLATNLEVKFNFYTYSNEKTLNYKMIQNQCTNTLEKENIIELTYCISKMNFKCKLNSKKKLQKTHLRLNLHLLKCFSITHNFLFLYEILAT